MKEVSVREARAVLARLEEVLQQEGELIITRHGRAIARLLPAKAARSMPSHRDLRQSMERLAVGSEVYVREDRDSR
jgi:antitoxin (DNA-binding transcriptional repressor) of toxin-antitoxin stability system